jgi:hypothetical protein
VIAVTVFFQAVACFRLLINMGADYGVQDDAGRCLAHSLAQEEISTYCGIWTGWVGIGHSRMRGGRALLVGRRERDDIRPATRRSGDMWEFCSGYG